MFETTGPSPGLRACTCVSVTLNGAVTVTVGAAVPVDPVTATLPVVPGSVHSGAPAFCGAAVGHESAAVGGAAVDVATGATKGLPGGVDEDEVDAVGVSDPQAATSRTKDAAQAASTADEHVREAVTVVHATRGRPVRWPLGRVWHQGGLRCRKCPRIERQSGAVPSQFVADYADIIGCDP